MTSGRQSATASATACEPSVCLSMGESPPVAGARARRPRRGGDVALGDRAGELGTDRVGDRIEA